MKIKFPVLVENGDIVKLYPGEKPEVHDKAPSGRLCVDGIVSMEDDSTTIRERKNIANNGYVEITIIISSKGEIVDTPQINFYGLPVMEKDDFKFDIVKELLKSLRTFSLNNIKQEENIIETLKKTCRKYAKEKTGKKPITNVNIVRI